MTNSTIRPFHHRHSENDPLLVQNPKQQATVGDSRSSHNPAGTIMDEMGTYDDFHTIDWLREMTRNRLRHRQLYKQGTSCVNYIKRFHDASSGWLVVFLVGLAAGVCAGMIDITTTWLSDIKLGVCSRKFWLSKMACCWGNLSSGTVQMQDAFSLPTHGCSWMTWSEIFGLDKHNATTIYVMNYFMYMVTAVVFATLGGILVKVLAPYASGSGIPEVKTILSGFIIRGYLGKWTLLIKSVTAPLAVASNLSLGKEGPLVHISACCGNLFAQLFPKYRRNEAKKREIFAAAAAAGVAVAFGAPIGGVLFSLEEVSYYFPMKTLWRSFFCALTAAFVLRSINPFDNPHSVMFFVSYDKPWFLFELIPFALIGALGGMIGAAFIHANLKWCKVRSTTKLGKYPIVEIIVLTIITTAAAYPNPYTRMGATAMINELVQECGPFSNRDLCNEHPTPINGSDNKDQSAFSGFTVACLKLLAALIFKFTITVFTFGIKLPAGLFIPSMAMGALMGRLVGIGTEQLVLNCPDWPLWKYSCGSGHSCVTPGLYAMVGAAATLGGVTRMTVSLVVVMFELTGGFAYIVPLMAAAMFSKWVGDAFGKEGIYDGHIRLNGYPFLDNKEEFIHTSLAADVMRPRLGEPPLKVVTQEGMSVNDLEILVQTTRFNGFPLITSVDSQKLVGYLYRRDLTIALENARNHCKRVKSNSKVYFTLHVPTLSSTSLEAEPVPLFNIVDLSPIVVSDHTPMEIVVEIFSKLGIRQTLVAHNGLLLGIITKKEVLRHIAKLNHEDPASIMFN